MDSSFDFLHRPGADYPLWMSETGGRAVPDYKALYFELFRASEQAIRLLQEAQLRAEQQVMEEDSTPVRLAPSSPPPSQQTSHR